MTGANERSIIMTSDQEYRIRWRDDFKRADLSAVQQVLERAKQGILYSIPQLVDLIQSLSLVRRNYEIHEIYNAYREYLPLLSGRTDYSSANQKFLEVVLRVEESLSNYHLCENLFSDYIKFPNPDPRIISIGLRTFLRNDNLQLAKQFFIQILDNPETFPITLVQLKQFIRELGSFNDLETVKYIFKLWLSKKCDESASSLEYYPDFETISMLHRLYLRVNDITGLGEFLALEAVKNTGYPTDVMLKVNEFCHQLRLKGENRQVSESFDVVDKINYFLAALQHRNLDRKQFYSLILDSLVMRKDFNSIRHVVERIRDDKEIQLDGSFHLIIAKFFVRQGLLNHLLQYYTDVVRNRAAGRIRLRVAHIQQLWLCALQSYPFLTREITNELRVILEDERYLREFGDLRNVLRQTSQVRRTRIMGGYEYQKSALSEIDFRRLREFEDALAQGDVAGATQTVLESLKQGTKPQFDFYFCAIRICLNSSLPSLAKLLNDIVSKSYKVPLKLNILWLRYDVLQQYQSTVSKSEMLSFSKVPLIESQLKDFQRSNQDSLNFQNYLQLSQISIFIRDYREASSLVEKASKRINEQDKQQWLMYYMTALKLSTRLYNARDFLRLLQEWNRNSNARLISRGCIRQLKAYTKLFSKRQAQLLDYDDELAGEISKEVELAVEKYVGLKFEGLNESRKLCRLLAKWLNQEMKEISKRERKKRKALDLAVANCSDDS